MLQFIAVIATMRRIPQTTIYGFTGIFSSQFLCNPMRLLIHLGIKKNLRQTIPVPRSIKIRPPWSRLLCTHPLRTTSFLISFFLSSPQLCVLFINMLAKNKGFVFKGYEINKKEKTYLFLPLPRPFTVTGL